MAKKLNRYSLLIEDIFFQYFKEGDTTVNFHRVDLEETADKLNIELPKNLGDVIYSFKYRNPLPESIIKNATDNKEWVIKNVGRSQYAFVEVTQSRILPDENLLSTKIPDATPSIVDRYSLGDEQALLAKLRYSRLLDIFTGVTCYSLQNHLRTTVPEIGQVEVDEIYVGIDKLGRQYIFPVQAKGGTDKIGVVQIEQDIRMCKHKFPGLICRPIATQFLDTNVISIFELTMQNDEVKKVSERHYELVLTTDISDEEIEKYNNLNS